MFFDQFKKIRGLVLDVDGVLTDGRVFITENGEQLRIYHVKDGYAIQLAVKQGFKIAIITGGQSASIRKRFNGLGVQDIHLGISDKLPVLSQWMEMHVLQPAEVLYMGDDIPDLLPMGVVGVAVCPKDAVEEVKALCNYISPKKGGDAAVRDVLEKVLKLQGKWDEDTSVKSV
ncbi:3-deoxy-D-manno-octulosonate 8-phosphate phosphatase (KDO 8-P phosphatase) [bacterium A37T11]|nr:3-deoxy-D-manno-octulosonate 8-phosphate phosphatase (KDO 8-P phosphatase) [bacterium A37T11]